VTTSAGDGSPRHDEGSPRSNGTGGVTGNPAQASLFLLEPTADAAMTHFYGQLFAMDAGLGNCQTPLACRLRI
jgi:hypothetical protein